jgi:hypothetical protein
MAPDPLQPPPIKIGEMRPPPLPHYPDWRNAAGEEASSSTGRHCRPPEPKSAIWATTKQLPLLREMRFFFIFILLFFSIFQKYIPDFLFCKFITLPPVHPSEASYRQMDRR